MKPRTNPIPPKPAPKPQEQKRAEDTSKIRELLRRVWGKPAA